MQPRKYGPFPFTPINRRPKIDWPDGNRLALWVIPNLEIFHLDTPMPGDNIERPGTGGRTYTPMVREWAQRDYGNRIGIYRIIEVLEKYGIRATAALNSDVCEAHPEIIEDTAKLGWEFIGHGRTNTHRQTEIPLETERAHIADVLGTIQRATGKRPVGWLGPGLQETWNTLDFLVEEGCRYVADWINDDQPYLMELERGRLVSIPYSFETNDSACIMRNKHTPLEFERILRDQFDVLYRESGASGRVLAIPLHPYIIGQPHRIGALDRALGYITAQPGVWKATGDEIVRHYLASGKTF